DELGVADGAVHGECTAAHQDGPGISYRARQDDAPAAHQHLGPVRKVSPLKLALPKASNTPPELTVAPTSAPPETISVPPPFTIVPLAVPPESTSTLTPFLMGEIAERVARTNLQKCPGKYGQSGRRVGAKKFDHSTGGNNRRTPGADLQAHIGTARENDFLAAAVDRHVAGQSVA